jgi:hypothetical protein
MYWLPFLWGIDGGEYVAHMRFLAYASSIDNANHKSLEGRNDSTIWRWLGVRTIWAYFEERLGADNQGQVAGGTAFFCLRLIEAQRDDFATKKLSG